MLERLKRWIISIFKKEKIEEETQKMLITLDQLYEINGKINKSYCEYYIEAFNKVLPTYNITTPLRLCHFLSQVLHESGHLKYKKENLNYSAQALRKVFGKYFPNDTIANEYARKPEKIANKVYANRMGNGNEASGDGWKFCGRGILQLTGKTNYENCSKDLNINILSNPELIVEDPIVNINVACWFWKVNKLEVVADKDDCLACTKKINGGTNGLSERQQLLKKAKEILM